MSPLKKLKPIARIPAAANIRILVEHQRAGSRSLLVETPPQRKLIRYTFTDGKRGHYEIPFPWLYFRIDSSKWGAPLIRQIFASGKRRENNASKGYRMVSPFFFFNQYYCGPCYGVSLGDYMDLDAHSLSLDQIANIAISSYWQEGFNKDGDYPDYVFWTRMLKRLGIRTSVTHDVSPWDGKTLIYDYYSKKAAKTILSGLEKLSTDDMLELYAKVKKEEMFDFRNYIK